MTVVFDVDGTLAETAPLVEEAYRRVGVVVRQEDLKRHWHEWLLPQVAGDVMEAERLRSLKTTQYVKLLKENPPRLSEVGKYAKKLIMLGDTVRVVTAAHPASTRALLRELGLQQARIIGTEVAGRDRPELLTALATCGTYYDDNHRTCDLVERYTRWFVERV